jgi:hypothetical protein
MVAGPGPGLGQSGSPDPGTPRSDEAPPAPNTERPLTHDELHLREEWTESGWDPTMFVAEAVIERSGPMRGTEDGRGGRAFGTLPRGGAFPGDPVVVAGKPVAALYPADATPVSGLLGIGLGGRSMQLLGSVAAPAGTYVTPVDPSAMGAADALPEGALIVVRGWLSSLGASGSCPEVPRALDPHDSGGGSSPFVRCPAGWLTADRVTDADPTDPTRPTAYGIAVQSTALERFGAAQDGRDAQAYLLRHVANPVETADPALGWQVIGRLDPVPVARPESPPAPAVTVRPGGLDWEAGLDRQPPADSLDTRTIAWAGGFASVHQGRDRVLSSWVSPDGRSWRGVELPPGIRWVSALLRLEDGLVIIADDDRFERVWRCEVWSSADGLSWQRIARPRVPMPARLDGYRRNVQGFWSLGDRIVALETYTTRPCCGGSSGWILVANREHERDVTYTWTSRDGQTWTRARTRGAPHGQHEHVHHLITQGEGELLAMWGHPTYDIGRSTDGVHWETMGHHPADLDLYAVPILLARTDDGLILGGNVTGVDDERSSDWLTLWRSSDGEDWERTLARPEGRPASIVSSGSTVIVAGNDLDPRYLDMHPPPELPWLVVSEDSGRTWDATLAWVGDADWCLRSLVANGATVSLDAACATPDAASTYLHRMTVDR